jgi:signal transduction histidine kinase
MTVKKRLARSNIIMILAPVLVTLLVVLGGVGLCIYSLETIYLPKLGLTLEQLHFVSEQFEGTIKAFETDIWIFVGILVATVIVTIILADKYLTRYITRYITQPLDLLVQGVDRIRDGDLESPIIYTEPDEFLPACDAVNLMAEKLVESNERFQEEQQRRRELFAGISHDLRSPLTSIRAYTEVLMEGVVKTPEAQMKYLGIIHSKEAEIEAMVEQLFAFSKMELSEYPLRIEVLDAREQIDETLKSAGVEHVAVDDSGLKSQLVLADRTLLDRVVLNILENSRKYRTGDVAHVAVSSRRAGNMVELRFADDGPGVPPEKLQRLFEAFYRADPSRKNPSGGSGLGLAIVRSAAERMKGSVRAENSEGGGLAIIMSLPAAEGAHDE